LLATKRDVSIVRGEGYWRDGSQLRLVVGVHDEESSTLID
jgi:hypothetical protein